MSDVRRADHLNKKKRLLFVDFLEAFTRLTKRKSETAETELEKRTREASGILPLVPYFTFTPERPNHSLKRIKEKAELLRKDDPREWNRFLPVLKVNIGRSKKLREYYENLLS